MRPPGSPQDLERRRLRAIELSKEDHPPVEVARIVGCDRRSVRRWNAAFRKGGGEGIKARPTPGRPPRLDEKAKCQRECKNHPLWEPNFHPPSYPRREAYGT
jgi:transposase